jgi:hypothetical protein
MEMHLFFGPVVIAAFIALIIPFRQRVHQGITWAFKALFTISIIMLVMSTAIIAAYLIQFKTINFEFIYNVSIWTIIFTLAFVQILTLSFIKFTTTDVEIKSIIGSSKHYKYSNAICYEKVKKSDKNFCWIELHVFFDKKTCVNVNSLEHEQYAFIDHILHEHNIPEVGHVYK